MARGEFPVELVPGDLAVVRAGSPFPADGIVIAGDELQADESALTGEAYPVRKRPFRGTALGRGPSRAVDTEHWGHAGTRLLTGTRDAARRVHRRRDALRRDRALRAQRQPARDAAQARDRRSRGVLLAAAAVLCVILAVVRLRQGYGWVDALVSAVTLAVAALPEEFPVVFTFFLGVGVYRLARRKALVRRAVSVENIGRVTCICSDKTGTITEGSCGSRTCCRRTESTERALVALAALASRRESGDPLDDAILRACAERSSRVRPAEVAGDLSVHRGSPARDRRRARRERLRSARRDEGRARVVLSPCAALEAARTRAVGGARRRARAPRATR